MPNISARQRIAMLFDSFDEFGPKALRRDPIRFPGYISELKKAGSASADESVIAGRAVLDGFDLVAAVFDFGFMGGSMGAAAGGRLDMAMQLAARRRIPFVAVTSSGGARMQEGMVALAQMPRTVAASSTLRSRGVPRISILAHPTTGGVYASFASLADFIVAEDGATIGFAGPRVAEAFTGAPLPEQSHTAKAAFDAGLVDALVQTEDLRDYLKRLLALLANRQGTHAKPPPLPTMAQASRAPDQVSAWSIYEVVRHESRPSPSWYVSQICSDWWDIRGDRVGADDQAVFCALGRFGDKTVSFIALDRASPKASGYRKARRVIDLAVRFHFPIVTLIDTKGADASYESEYTGLAGEIARTFESLLGARVPVITMVTGEGGSGGALALACGDLIGIQKYAVFSVIAPEGAASILYRDPSKASEVADLLRPLSSDLIDLGLADQTIPEPSGGAHRDPQVAARMLSGWLSEALENVKASPRRRASRYRHTRRHSN